MGTSCWTYEVAQRPGGESQRSPAQGNSRSVQGIHGASGSAVVDQERHYTGDCHLREGSCYWRPRHTQLQSVKPGHGLPGLASGEFYSVDYSVTGHHSECFRLSFCDKSWFGFDAVHLGTNSAKKTSLDLQPHIQWNSMGGAFLGQSTSLVASLFMRLNKRRASGI